MFGREDGQDVAANVSRCASSRTDVSVGFVAPLVCGRPYKNSFVIFASSAVSSTTMFLEAKRIEVHPIFVVDR